MRPGRTSAQNRARFSAAARGRRRQGASTAPPPWPGRVGAQNKQRPGLARPPRPAHQGRESTAPASRPTRMRCWARRPIPALRTAGGRGCRDGRQRPGSLALPDLSASAIDIGQRASCVPASRIRPAIRCATPSPARPPLARLPSLHTAARRLGGIPAIAGRRAQPCPACLARRFKIPVPPHLNGRGGGGSAQRHVRCPKPGPGYPPLGMRAGAQNYAGKPRGARLPCRPCGSRLQLGDHASPNFERRGAGAEIAQARPPPPPPLPPPPASRTA